MTAKRTATIATFISAICVMSHSAPALADAVEEGFKPIFDGKTLDGWDGNLKVWRVQDGAIVGGKLSQPMEHHEYLCTKKQYEDFELRLKAKVIGQRNSGVQVRTRRVPDSYRVVGYQVDMGGPRWGVIWDEGGQRRALIGGDQEKLKKAVKPGEFHDLFIRCQGPRIQISINGQLVTDFSEPDEKIARERRKGVIGFQCHQGPGQEASFKDIRIKELPGSKP